MIKFTHVATVILLTLPSYGATEQIPGSQFRVGAWQGDANVDERSKRFSYCTIGQANQQGYGLVISLNFLGKTQLSLYSANSSFVGDKKIDFGVSIDTKPAVRIAGYKLENGENNFVTMPIADTAFLDQLADGNKLQLKSYVGDIFFSLRSSKNAIKKLIDCVQRFS